MSILNYNYKHDIEKISYFYKIFGFIIIRNFFDTKKIKNIKKQILDLTKKKIKNKFFYYEKIEKKSKLRRIENVFDFSKIVKKIIISKRIFDTINMLEKGNYILFKDKLNFKFAGGEGYMPHIDGHFLWKDRSNHKQYGWKKYSNNFVNFVIPLEKTDKSNGCLYIAKKSETEKIGRNFKKIIKNLDPNKYTLTKRLIKKIKFYPIELNQGDLCIFNWKCAHYSKKNYSKNSRMIFYLTFCQKNKNKNFKKFYYFDKDKSKGSESEKSLLHN